MKLLGFTSILLGGVLVLLLVSVILMSYMMWIMTSAKADDKVADLWGNSKIWMITPTVTNVVGMVMIGLLFVMG